MRRRRIPQNDAFRCSTTASAAPKLLSVLLGRFSSLVAGRQRVFEGRLVSFYPPETRAFIGTKRRDEGCPQAPGRRVLNDPPSSPVDNPPHGVEQHSGGKEARAQRLR
jgi:hypothetical protein